MITTITLNTAVDKLYMVQDVQPDTVMRVQQVVNTAGGKGLNVAKVARLAGEKVCAMGFVGGFNGQYVQSLLAQQGVEPRFTQTEGETRSCINIRNLATGRHTEYLEPGVPVTPANIAAFLQEYDAVLPSSGVVTLSGSIPAGTPPNIYPTLIKRARQARVPILLDTSGALLVSGVKALPTLIKPNKDEIVQLLGEDVASKAEMIAAAKQLHSDGIRYVALSLGKEGALLVCEEGVFVSTTPDIPVVNTVGCGDSMIAGFAVGIARGYNAAKMLQFATAISTANALSIQTGHFEQEHLEKLLLQVNVRKVF